MTDPMTDRELEIFCNLAKYYEICVRKCQNETRLKDYLRDIEIDGIQLTPEVIENARKYIEKTHFFWNVEYSSSVQKSEYEQNKVKISDKKILDSLQNKVLF